MSWIPFVLGLIIASVTLIFVAYKDIATRSTLKKSEEQCAGMQPFHVFVYGGDEPSQRLEEICKVFDFSKCPKLLQVHILVPLLTPHQVTPWDTDLVGVCQSMPTYNVFFSENVHLYKYNYKKATGILKKTVEILRGIESISLDSAVLWLPSLTILQKHWDVLIRTDLALSDKIKFQVFPLLKYIPSSFLEVINSILGTHPKASPGYFFIDPFMLSFDVRELQQAFLGTSYGLSLRYPFACTKQTFLALQDSTEQDLALSCYVAKTFGISSVVHSSVGIGKTLIKNMPSREQSRVQLNNAVHHCACDEWLSETALEANENGDFKVHGRAILGMNVSPTLQEKLAKWGSEAKYESAKESVLF